MPARDPLRRSAYLGRIQLPLPRGPQGAGLPGSLDADLCELALLSDSEEDQSRDLVKSNAQQ